MNKHFGDLPLSFDLIKRLDRINFKIPTPIQLESIPKILNGNDIFASAQTGTGKTGAFIIPILNNLLLNTKKNAIILAPTRELATQILDFSKLIITRQDYIRPTLIIGGQSMERQISFLSKSPRLIIGTPGRINDHIKKNTINLKKSQYIVLDEADRMLDMGFLEQLEGILSQCPPKRQTLMFTATKPNNITKIANKYLIDPVNISIGSALKPIENISINNIFVDKDKKFNTLEKELKKLNGSVVIFVNTKRGTENIASKLSKQNFKVEFIHGDLRQSKRDRIIKNYRQNRFNILVATDVAARGLDIPHVSMVVNYDLPLSPEDYIHRIGRTGRAGTKGASISLVIPEQKNIFECIEHFIKTGNKLKLVKKKSKPRGKGRSFGLNTSTSDSKKFNNRSYKKISDRKRVRSKSKSEPSKKK